MRETTVEFGIHGYDSALYSGSRLSLHAHARPRTHVRTYVRTYVAVKDDQLADVSGSVAVQCSAVRRCNAIGRCTLKLTQLALDYHTGGGARVWYR